jgi:FMN-dependent NADH-azoreductase
MVVRAEDRSLMSTLFRLDASIRQEGSATRALADTLQQALEHELGPFRLVRRDVGRHPLDAHTWADSVTASMLPVDQRSAGPSRAAATAATLADEVLAADTLVFAVPLYNWGVSQHFKTWFDVTVTDPRLGPGTVALAGRPAFLVTARGGGYGPGTPREGWDHATGWMRRALADVWQLDLRVIETELTQSEVTPAMAPLRDEARRLLEAAHVDAAAEARRLAARLRQVA